ncbi:MAG TPA: amylo-alpha-1,6-glucosidase, partial [Casimicrobiaceae bacterium]|nr:amylo-alpha-1,6-glucosidase [Casimicrobiaceae bacterium]
QRRHEKGLENQGWKDSRDGVSFPDGTIAAPPIALVEVQGYSIAALEGMAAIYTALDRFDRATALQDRANELREALDRAFWMDDLGYHALALDGRDRRVPTIASNPGHLLACGAVAPDRAARMIETLLAGGMYSGYGIRTVARGQAVYNPLSYHNGSVWPHDNAIIAIGASRYGHVEAPLKIMDGLFLAAQHFRRGRLPELFCGLARAEGDFLVHYPVSCSPQAWASGALFLILHACLGLLPDGPRKLLRIRNPRLPAWIDKLDLCDMRVGGGRLSLHFAQHGKRTHADVVGSEGDAPRVQIEID